LIGRDKWDRGESIVQMVALMAYGDEGLGL
jgi:hypothetical protein